MSHICVLITQIDEFANHSRTLIDFQDTTTWVEHQSNVSNITNSSRFSTDYMGYVSLNALLLA